MNQDRLAALVETRANRPSAIAEAAARRARPTGPLGEHGKLMVIAADHPARGALGAGDRPLAMGDRLDLLDRLCTALARPGVNGVLGTSDILEDLLLLGALEGKVVIGSMNRGGLAGAVFEMDDRFTGYDAAMIEAMRFDGGKTLTRIDYADPASVDTLESTAKAVTDLASRDLLAMVEPFISRRVDGKARNVLTTDAVVKAAAIAAGLGTTSAYTWLKLPVVDDMERVMAATTLPVVILGGEVDSDQEAVFSRWRKALACPTARGLAVGRSLLYPPDDDVVSAVDAAVALL
ncbi:aldolase [Nonomuraea sp. NPDC049152]|uniref:Cgl0159 family (beta/alpha)8-fold protein n=1 Tax=Nonomuraea sp. NPDC049152 TaxID=3154350 RepID=UPI0033E93273